MPASRVQGLSKGIIVDIDDPSGYRRVRVRIPQLHGAFTEEFYGPNGYEDAKVNRVKDEHLPWAEVCTPYWSEEGPQLNQVVIVGFISGDPNKPVILGCLGYDYTNKEEPLRAVSRR